MARPKLASPQIELTLEDRQVAPEGSLHACLYLVGEAPGRQEAALGRPFVGPAGEALREMMREAAIDTTRIRLANAIPFRPIKRAARDGWRNRAPTKREVRTYGGCVLNDILKVKPNVIVAMGKSAASLFDIAEPIAEARKHVFEFKHLPVCVIHHPSYVLRFGGKGSPLWRSMVRDLKRLWETAQKPSR